ncbi:hypothetical protein [Aestuariibacter salexigens]|uniref:hypothetical protein n=1 Tax=Aestuariibacter salexigens TaxID=226010 RepID=UPI000688A578|nr:hypothetical protein [Aestuariibacter salexigens]
MTLSLRRTHTLFISLICCVLLAACSEYKAGEGAGKYGMMDPNTPEFAAVKFFESIFLDDNLDGALEFSTERMQRLLKSYHTNRNVQRHVLNLSYDSVEIMPDSGDNVGRNEFAKSAVITLFFTGYYNDDKIDDLRTVELIRESGKWRVDEVRADPFM